VLRRSVKRTVSMALPRLSIKAFSQRHAKSVTPDENNFSSARALETLLLPYEVVSFDLFDTIVWREVALADVHRKTSEFADHYLRGDDGPLPQGLLLHSRGRYQDMLKQRGLAQNPPRNEVDLRAVFDGALAPYIKAAERRAAAVQALLDYEIETERQVLTVDPDMRDLLVRLRTQGKCVILISDMYLGEEQMLPLLEGLGLKSLFDHIFVSATVGVTKHSGALFAHVDAALGLAGKKRFHLGDNWTNDVTRPRENGWDSLHYFNPENEERKIALEAAAAIVPRPDRRARRDLLAAMGVDDPAQGTLRLMAASLSLFARQALSIGIKEGYDRILFLTRDGTLFHELADQYLSDCGALPNLNLPSLEEFAFSRRAGILLNYPETSAPHWRDYLQSNTQWIVGHPVSLRGIIKAFGLSPQDLKLTEDQRRVVETCLEDTRPETDLGLDDLISHHPALLSSVHATLIERRNRIRRYLRDIGLLSRDQKILLVDIGYSGTAAKALSEYMNLEDRGGQPVRGRLSLLMFASNRFLQRNLPQMHPRMALLPPLLIGQDAWRHRALAANFAWLEPFTVDRRRGSLRDFTRNAQGDLTPVFAPPPVHAQGGGVDRAALLAAAREIEHVLRQSPMRIEEANRLIAQTFTHRFSQPKAETVRSMEQVTHHAGITEVKSNDVIIPIRARHIISDLRHCLYEDHWVQGSLKNARLGWLTPAVNRLIGLITK